MIFSCFISLDLGLANTDKNSIGSNTAFSILRAFLAAILSIGYRTLWLGRCQKFGHCVQTIQSIKSAIYAIRCDTGKLTAIVGFV